MGDGFDDGFDASVAVERLRAYIHTQGGSICMAGPPTLLGSLAHFYKENQDIAQQMKYFHLHDWRPGIHSIVAFEHLHSAYDDDYKLRILGSKNNKRLTTSNHASTDHMTAYDKQVEDKQRNITELRTSALKMLTTIRAFENEIHQLLSQVERL